MPSVAIVGGGILGMVLAARLRRRGADVTLLEAGMTAGGLAAPCRHGTYTWDRFYHVILLSDGHTRGLLGELGLEDMLRWRTTRTGFYIDGALHSLSNSFEFATFPALSASDKARLAWTIIRASRIRDGQPLEAVAATEWLERHSGPRVVERIWRPLLRAKLGDNYRQASAAFIWAIIQRMYAARRSGLKREMFGYVDGGYAVVLERLQRQLDLLGVRTITGFRATRVTQREAEAEVRDATGAVLAADHAVLTVPCGRVAELCPQLTGEERSRLRGVVYQGIACASVLLRRPLAGFYVTNIADTAVPFTGIIEMTALVDRARFGGSTLAYLPWYLTQDDAAWGMDDESIRVAFLTGLSRIYPAVTESDVLAFQVSRARDVLALPTLNYTRDHLPPLRTSLPRVHVANSAQIAQGTLNVNETIGLADAQARALAPVVLAPAPQAAGIP